MQLDVFNLEYFENAKYYMKTNISWLSSPDALGLEPEQHTQITWKYQFNCDMHDKVGRWKLGWYYNYSNIYSI